VGVVKHGTMSDSADSLSSAGPKQGALPASDIVVPTLAELFIGFFKITVSGFGGVLAWARREMVTNRRWMSADEFNELFALCQFLPGPNIVNFSIIYGTRLYGFWGAAAALVGLLAPPVVLMIIAGMIYSRYGELPLFRGGLTGLAAAAAGLLLATAGQMAEPLIRKERVPQLVVALAAFLAVGVFKLSMLWALLVLVPVSIAIAWKRLA
jgi:chromate transporter